MKKNKILINKKKKCVFIVLDAFRGNYINSYDTPFLNSLLNNSSYCLDLITSKGFTQPHCILTGKDPLESNVFTLFDFEENKGILKSIKNRRFFLFLLKIYKTLRVINFSTIRVFAENIFFNNLIQPYLNLKHPRFYKPYGAPIDFFEHLKINEENNGKLISEVGSLNSINQETIIDILFKNEYKTKFLMSPISDGMSKDVYENILINYKKYTNFDLIIHQINDTDSKIHALGPDSIKSKDIIASVDRYLKKIFNIYKKAFSNDEFLFLLVGDHGMSQVKIRLNIMKVLKSFFYKYPNYKNDIIYWIDSTMLRLWILNKDKKIKKIIHNQLAEFFDERLNLKNEIHKVDKKFIKKYKLPNKRNTIGDLCYWAQEGVMFDPCFFRGEGNSLTHGMHGYLDDLSSNDTRGFFISYNSTKLKKKKYDNQSLKIIFNLIKNHFIS